MVSNNVLKGEHNIFIKHYISLQVTHVPYNIHSFQDSFSFHTRYSHCVITDLKENGVVDGSLLLPYFKFNFITFMFCQVQ